MDLRKFKNIVVLTGAGISAESGLKTFRDNNGLWEGHRVEEVATPEAFERNPNLVHEFYNLRRASLKNVMPNAAHMALADFEKTYPGRMTIITQNVDDLHERAGSKNIYHMHGELKKVRCISNAKVYDWDQDLTAQTLDPVLKKPKLLRPHICWFGETPFYLEEIDKALRMADLFVAIGTSGLVYPAAGLVRATSSDCYRVLINKEEASNNPYFDQVILGMAGDQVPEFFLGDS